MTQLTVFGKEVKKKLVDMDAQNQAWLMDKINGKTGLLLIAVICTKSLTGKRNAQKSSQLSGIF